jgi:MFS family permease
MRPEFTVSADEKSGLASLIDGFRYTRGNASIRSVFFLLAVCSIFGWSYTSLLPTIAERVFRVPSQGYGVLLSACGVGALIGAIAVGRLKDGRNLPKFLIGGWFVFIVALAGFGLSGTYAAGLVAIFGIGLGLSTLNVAGNSLVQTLVTDAYRGRVMGLYMFLWAGLGTVGSYVVGRMAEVIGMGTTLIVNSVICLAAVVIVRSRIAAAARDITLHVHVSSVAPHPLPLAPEALPLAAETRPAIALEEQDAS